MLIRSLYADVPAITLIELQNDTTGFTSRSYVIPIICFVIHMNIRNIEMFGNDNERRGSLKESLSYMAPSA